MATKNMTLPIEHRVKIGTTGAQALRRDGKIPGILYGHGTAPLHLAFDAKVFDELLHKGARTSVLTLTLDGKKADTALVREVSRNPVSRKIEHVDLQRVSEHEAVHAKLPLVAVGVARGVREFGGVLDVLVHDIDVEGPVDEFPDHLEIDVSELGIHQHALAGDIKLPKSFKLLIPADTTVVAVESSKTAQHLEEAATGATAEQAAPEVIGAKPETPG
ncbi:MAG TPA: 50S ribosomal protein L25 [Candidatus Baltobacteraceae bacterium]|nr:50S ribosomal protein L25 [Candidatus Baltobacteraceae bacterium]